ncbi:MAG: hypothetical protein H7841_09050 [Magnetospirillum sp. WYHS-4]
MFARSAEPDGKALWLVWQRAASGYHHHVMTMDTASPEVRGVGGVYLIWHLGSPPEWIAIGDAEDIGATLDRLRSDPAFAALDPSGGLYATWVELDGQSRSGVVRYLSDLLRPALGGRTASASPIPVNIPH